MDGNMEREEEKRTIKQKEADVGGGAGLSQNYE